MDTAVPSSTSVASLLASRGGAAAPFVIDVRRIEAFEADAAMLARG